MLAPEVVITRDHIATALDCDQFVLAYQPQWRAQGGQIASFEALARWEHPEFGRLAPDRFLAVTEAAGLIPQLTERLLERLCREGRDWNDLPIALNVSPAEFADPGLVETICQTATRLKFPLSRLEIEIVETSFFADLDRAETTLDALRTLGCSIALDDFGTGYSSLSLLRRLPFDKVKIDKCFIDDIASLKSASIVYAVIALARACGLKVTAEGVETTAQQAFLKTAGCHYLQGYLLSRPLDPVAVEALLATQSATTSQRPRELHATQIGSGS